MAYVRKRITALLIDWLTICGHLFLLAAIVTAGFFVFQGEIPEFTSTQSQVVATFASVIPAIVWFTFVESREPFASFGKHK